MSKCVKKLLLSMGFAWRGKFMIYLSFFSRIAIPCSMILIHFGMFQKFQSSFKHRKLRKISDYSFSKFSIA